MRIGLFIRRHIDAFYPEIFDYVVAPLGNRVPHGRSNFDAIVVNPHHAYRRAEWRTRRPVTFRPARRTSRSPIHA